MKKIIDFINHLGPGILLASAAIGTSHLIQSGINLELDYSYLQNYISENPFRIDTLDEFNFSKKELKILDRDIGEVASKFLYKPKI